MKISLKLHSRERLFMLLAILLFLPCVQTIVDAQDEVPAPQNVFSRKSQTLNGSWNYFVDVQEQGYYDYRMNPLPWGYFLNAKPQRPSDLIEYDFDSSPTMEIPCDWNTQSEQLFLYEGTVWFKRDFDYNAVAGRRSLLYFGAVNYESLVFVNGKYCGTHVGGFTPFCYDVTDLLHDGKNFVVLKVDNKRGEDKVPTRNFDWWNYGGITRDVLLLDVSATYIDDYTVQLSKVQDDKKNWKISFSANLNVKTSGIPIKLSIPELGISQSFVTNGGGEVSGVISTSRKSLKLWSPTRPKLYTVELSLPTDVSGEPLLDEIGFRTIETRGKDILLNGEPIFLRGVCAHEETAYSNRRCTNKEDAATLLGWARELGCNFLRLAHYPHNEHAIREAERQGFLVWSEIPVYWTISWENEETYKNAERQLSDMIRRDHNRASVIIWSIANETPHSESRDKFLGSLADHARSLDDIRLISMAMEVTSASNYLNRLHDNMHDKVDVVSFNQYVGWYRDVNDAPKMSWEIPYEKPVIVSEFGGGAKAGYHGSKEQRWTEEFQENLYRENLSMLEKIDGLRGTCPWVLKDFRSPRRPLPGIQDLFNRKGLVSDQGEKKKAFYVLQEWYRSR